MGGWMALSMAVVSQAVSDYRKGNKESKDVERFFKSEWFQVLTTIDGNVILEKLEKEKESGNVQINQKKFEKLVRSMV